MNEASLPLDYAPFRLVSVNGDGSFLRCPFTTRELAEQQAIFLRGLNPAGTYFVTEPTPVLPAFKGKL